MRKQNNKRIISSKESVGKSRKVLRKQKKEAKMQKKREFYNKKSIKKAPRIDPAQTYNQRPTKQSKASANTKPNVKQQKIKASKIVNKRQENQDDVMIRQYEQKLGIAEGKDKYGKIAKKFGFDQDIFDFLKNITKKVNDNSYSYTKGQVENRNQQQSNSQDQPSDNNDQIQQEEDDQIQQEEDDQIQQEDDSNEQGEDDQQMIEQEEQDGEQFQQQQGSNEIQEQFGENDQFDKEFDEMFDNLDQVDRSFYQQPTKKSKKPQKQKQASKKAMVVRQDQQQMNVVQRQLKRQRMIGSSQKIQRDQIAIKKSMNALFNKLSDGNILISFRSFVEIIQNNPRAIAIPLYSELFTRFNLIIQKPLFHILAANIALASSLHYAFGNRLLAPVLHTLTKKYIQLSKEKDDVQQVQQIGYSKRFERLKNYAMIVSLLYNYSSISGQFIESYVGWLTKGLNKENIQLIYIIVQKSGMKIRQNDPSTLKNIILLINEAIAAFKKSLTDQATEMQKIHFIEMELSEIKFNKKSQSNPDQRMAFLETFINKNVPKEIETQKQFFPLKFQDLIHIDTSRTNWWQGQQQSGLFNDENGEQEMQQYNEINEQKRKLLQLAKSFHLVTEIKKNIFLCLMQAKDYLQATQKILELKVHSLQDIATVLIQVCTLEPSFNPYYALVAAKIASINPKFRLNLQYSIWDHLKLIHQYELRRTSNLAKFSAKLISDPLSNSSLSTLKFFPDLSNIRTIDTTFLNIFFTYFFKKIKRDYLSKLVSKLREKNNRGIKQGIKQFLSQFESGEQTKQKLKLCKRFLMIEMNDEEQFRGDDDE